MALTLTTAQIRTLLGTMTSETAQTVVGATNASPSLLTVANHGYSTGDVVYVSGALGDTSINGLRRVVVVDANDFSLTDFVTGAAVAGNDAYTASSASVYRVKLGLRPGDIEDLKEALDRTSYIGGSDSNRAAEHTVASILGV